MHFSTTLVCLAAIPYAAAYWAGFNIGANNPDGSCKSESDWEAAFTKLQGLPQHMTSVRLYASSDCNTLANAVPAAVNTGTQILVGIWAEDSNHFGAEKQALLDAISAHGSDWIIAVTVGSEDLYRGDTSASALAQQIYDVRGMINSVGVQKEVGHVDTWTAWVNGDNKEVITASDFIGMDGYPYFQGSKIEDSIDVFWQSVYATRDVVNQVAPGKWVWVTETGWPVSGPDFGNAVASTTNARIYWANVGCQLLNSAHFFWYAYQDYNASPSFGVFDSNGNALFDTVSC